MNKRSLISIVDELDACLDEIFEAEGINFQSGEDECDPHELEPHYIDNDITEKIVLIDCPDCKATGIYIGIGMYPADQCRLCKGAKKIRK